RLRVHRPELEPELGTFVERYEAHRFAPAQGRQGLGELRKSRRQLLRRWRQLRGGAPGREEPRSEL
ncbi:MAG: hypothetical protein ACKO28_11765, partial [Cyanobium sp.]